MMENLRSSLLALTAAALLSALVMALTPKGNVRRVQGIACGILVVLVCLSPLSSLDGEGLMESLSRFRMEAEEARTGVEVRNRELVTSIIKQNTETYILDKAAALGAEVTVEAEMAGEDTYPYPRAVTVTGLLSPAQREALSRYIEENLAIAKEHQRWKE